MYRYVTVDGASFLEAFYGDLISDATIGSEDLILLQTDDFTYAHTGVNTETKYQAVARALKQLENRVNLFGTEDFCLSRHACNGVDEKSKSGHFVYVKAHTFFGQADVWLLARWHLLGPSLAP